MHRMVKASLFLALGVATAFAAGCGKGGGSAAPQEAYQQNVLNEVGEILQVRKTDAKPPATRAADLARYENGWPGGYRAIKDGTVVVIWGASPEDEVTDKVIAYEKQVPESGGFVLMQDGKTVRKMTAEEFKAAPKAGKG